MQNKYYIKKTLKITVWYILSMLCLLSPSQVFARQRFTEDIKKSFSLFVTSFSKLFQGDQDTLILLFVGIIGGTIFCMLLIKKFAETPKGSKSSSKEINKIIKASKLKE